jgi:hypothetical protein
MLTPEQRSQLERIERLMFGLMFSLIAFFVVVVLSWNLHTNEEFLADWFEEEPMEEIVDELPEFENGIHLATGFIQDEHIELIIGNCTNCHSAKMVTQNRATREGWLSMIRWMQETQGFWDLGDNEKLILDYLEKNYAPENKGRRAPLTNIDWYALED